MKLLYCIFTIFVAANAESNSIEVTDNEDILHDLQRLKKICGSLRRQVIDIKASLPTLTQEISEAIHMHPLVISQSKQLDTAEKNGNPVDKCQEIFDTQYKRVVDKLYEYVSKEIKYVLKRLRDNLDDIEKKRADSFVNKIKTGQLSESEIEHIIKQLDEDFYEVDYLQAHAQIVVQNNLDDMMYIKPAADIIRDDLLKPTSECLHNFIITTYQKN